MIIIIIFLLVTFLCWLSVYLDGRFNDKVKYKLDYFKAIVFTNAIVFGTLFALYWLAPSSTLNQIFSTTMKGGSALDKIVNDNIIISAAGEAMYTGAPDF